MSDKKNDYGYYGKGTSGYMYYKQDFDRNFSGGRKQTYGLADWIALFIGLAIGAGAIGLWLLIMYVTGSILPN